MQINGSSFSVVRAMAEFCTDRSCCKWILLCRHPFAAALETLLRLDGKGSFCSWTHVEEKIPAAARHFHERPNQYLWGDLKFLSLGL